MVLRSLVERFFGRVMSALDEGALRSLQVSSFSSTSLLVLRSTGEAMSLRVGLVFGDLVPREAAAGLLRRISENAPTAVPDAVVVGRVYKPGVAGVAGEQLVSRAVVVQVGADLENLQVWCRGALAGQLLVRAGDGAWIAACLGLELITKEA